MTPEQRNTSDLLRALFGDIFADRYADFLRLASGDLPLRVSLPLAAHALREIESTLRSILRFPFKDIEPTETEAGLLERAQAYLSGEGFDANKVTAAIRALSPKLTHEQEIKSIVGWLELPAAGDVANAWLSWVGEQQAFAHKRSFTQSLVVDDAFRAAFMAPLQLVVRETALALQRRYGALFDRVDELAARTDYTAALKAFKGEIPGALPLQLRFFEKIEGEGWLPQVEKQNLLLPPAQNVDDQEAGIVRWRDWPPGNYLLRMASSERADTRSRIAGVMRALADAEDAGVREKCYEIVVALPAGEAAQLADVAVKWISKLHYWSLKGPEKLVSHLLGNGEPDAALRVATALLDIVERNGRLATNYDRFMYEDALPRVVRPLTEHIGLPVVGLLASLLTRTAEIEGHYKSGADYTYIAVSHLRDPDLHRMGVYYALIGTLRDVVLQLIDDDPSNLPAIIEALEASAPKIIRSLCLIAIAAAPDQVAAKATAYLKDESLLAASWCEREYGALAQAWFAKLDGADQAEILDAVAKLPDRYEEQWRTRFEEQQARPPNDNEVEAFRESTVRDAVWYWRDVMPADWQERVARAEANHGMPFGERMARGLLFRNESTSPLDDEELSQRPPDEIASFLREWRPSEENRRHTPGALAFRVRQSAEADPTQYANAAAHFLEVPHVYVKSMLEGIGSANRNGRVHDWNPLLLAMSTWVEQPLDPEDFAEDQSGEGRLAANIFPVIAELLAVGLRRGNARIPIEDAELVSKVLRGLLRIAGDDLLQSRPEAVFDGDAYFTAQSTVCGAALEALILSAWWRIDVGHEHATRPAEERRLTETEKGLLEDALLDNGPLAPAIHAICGRYLNLLNHLDNTWTEGVLDIIFSTFDASQRQSAWDGHLLHDHVSFEMWRRLEPEYRAALFSAAPGSLPNDRRHECLAVHTVSLFLNKEIDLAPGSLLSDLIVAGDVHLRQRVMWLVAERLPHPAARVSDETIDLAYRYIEARLDRVEAADARQDWREELSMVGLHFKTARDQPRMLTVASRMSALRIAPAHSTTMIEWLAETAPANLDVVLQCLNDLVLDNGVARWMFGANRDHVRQILELALIADDALQKRAHALVNILLSLGETSFIDLKK